MKEAIIVDINGNMIDVSLVEDVVTGILPMYAYIPSEQDESTLEEKLIGYIVSERVPEGLHQPKFDLSAWEIYNAPLEPELDEDGEILSDENGNVVYKPKLDVKLWIEGKEFDIKQYKQNKIDYIWSLREQELNSTFTSIVNDAPIIFDYSDVSQARFQKQATLLSINPNINEIQWGTPNGFITVDRETFVQILNDAAQHELSIEFKYLYARANIENSTTKEQIDNIIDSWHD